MYWYGRNIDRKFEKKKDFISLGSIDGIVLDEDPDFLDYLFFHNVVDKFCWLLKLQYADRDTVKNKKYRIDTLFQRFMISSKFKISKAKKCISNSVSEQKIEYHLSKGWLNEVVRSVPLHPDYLEIGTMLYDRNGPGSEGLMSWNIIQSYYSFYEFMCSLGISIEDTLDTRGHKGVAKAYSNRLIGKGNNQIIFYPFNLTSRTPKAYIPAHPNHCKYHYASYPREPGRGICDLESEMQKAFSILSPSGK